MNDMRPNIQNLLAFSEESRDEVPMISVEGPNHPRRRGAPTPGNAWFTPGKA
jgi:hypothetical protein